jgi:transcriptional antiterminator RfaH
MAAGKGLCSEQGMSEIPPATWFCIKSKPRQEAVAVLNLRALGEVEIVFPRLRRTRKGHDKNRVVVEPLFPGYIFVKFDPEELHGPVRNTRGVLQLVSRNGRPVDVDASVITELLALGPDATLSMLDEELKIGAKVRVIRGIFSGSEGEVVKLQEPQKRIAVLLSLLGSEQAVEMPLDDVEGLSDES